MFFNLRKVVFIAVLLKTIFLTLAHPSSTSYYRNNYNAKCKDPETNRELYIGDSFTRSGQCIRVQCLDSLQIWEDKCKVPQLEGSCHRLPPANEFLDYPRCCSNYECSSSKVDDNSNMRETRTYDQYGRLLREHITQRVYGYLSSREVTAIKPPTATTTTNYATDDLNDVNAKKIRMTIAEDINTNERVYDIN